MASAHDHPRHQNSLLHSAGLCQQTPLPPMTALLPERSPVYRHCSRRGVRRQRRRPRHRTQSLSRPLQFLRPSSYHLPPPTAQTPPTNCQKTLKTSAKRYAENKSCDSRPRGSFRRRAASWKSSRRSSSSRPTRWSPPNARPAPNSKNASRSSSVETARSENVSSVLRALSRGSRGSGVYWRRRHEQNVVEGARARGMYISCWRLFFSQAVCSPFLGLYFGRCMSQIIIPPFSSPAITLSSCGAFSLCI